MSGRNLLHFTKRLFSNSGNSVLCNSVELSGSVTRVYQHTSVKNNSYYVVQFKTINENKPLYLSCLVFSSNLHSICENLRISDHIRITGDIKSNGKRAPTAVSVIASSMIVDT